MSSRQFVTLKVYDLLGKEVATLVNEEKPAGEYEVEFDGSSLTSGIYFYQLKAGSFVEARKMVLLK
ncbi:MAG: T9SS type A sorting domain-containing protein [Ignavibacteriaceae bacterium]|nr:T9SS type A sorting domain-containing protein [Ignavibacteriaceae bacterium]